MAKAYQPATAPSEIDWARLAAYVDGEGHIAIKDSKYKTKSGEARNYHVMTVAVHNSGIYLMKWLVKTFGGAYWLSHSKHNRPAHWHDCWKWELSSGNAENALRHILPFLLVKSEQAEVALALRATVSKRGIRVVRDAKGHILGHMDVDPAVLEKRAALKTKIMEINSRRGSVVNG